MTRFQLHVGNWSGCTRCALAGVRDRVVISRGKIPCQVLFVGEAPGESEDCIGIPFVGVAGKLLDVIIECAIPRNLGISTAFTNLVGCIPEEDTPEKEHIEACAPRVRDFVSLSSPEAIVCVGNLSWENLPRILKKKTSSPIPMLKVIHPAAILRMPYSSQSLKIQDCIWQIKSFCEENLECLQRKSLCGTVPAETLPTVE